MRKTQKNKWTQDRTSFFLIGLIISLSLTWYAFEKKSFEKPAEFDIYYATNNIVEEDMLNTVRKEPEKPKPNLENPNIVEVDNNTEIDTKFKFDVEIGADDIIDDQNFDNYVDETTMLTDNTPFVIVEDSATFKGGMKNLFKFIYSNIEYPELARELGIEGIVYVEFIVERDGSVNYYNIARGIGYGCDEQVKNVMEKMPDWNPGKQRGIPVRVKYSLPVHFKLKNN